VTALYEAHALGLVRLAVVMTGDQSGAEDIVQDAFLGLTVWPSRRCVGFARDGLPLATTVWQALLSWQSAGC